MKKLLLSTALGMLVLLRVASAQSGHCITDTPGSTSTSNWIVILQTSEIGLISTWHRYRASEPRRQGECIRVLVAADPGGRPDTVLTGTTAAGTWSIKLNISRENEITRIWGVDATGQHWIGSLGTRNIHRDEPRRRRQTTPKNIY